MSGWGPLFGKSPKRHFLYPSQMWGTEELLNASQTIVKLVKRQAAISMSSSFGFLWWSSIFRFQRSRWQKSMFKIGKSYENPNSFSNLLITVETPPRTPFLRESFTFSCSSCSSCTCYVSVNNKNKKNGSPLVENNINKNLVCLGEDDQPARFALLHLPITSQRRM